MYYSKQSINVDINIWLFVCFSSLKRYWSEYSYATGVITQRIVVDQFRGWGWNMLSNRRFDTLHNFCIRHSINDHDYKGKFHNKSAVSSIFEKFVSMGPTWGLKNEENDADSNTNASFSVHCMNEKRFRYVIAYSFIKWKAISRLSWRRSLEGSLTPGISLCHTCPPHNSSSNIKYSISKVPFTVTETCSAGGEIVGGDISF